jgi:hypothetical protein
LAQLALYATGSPGPTLGHWAVLAASTVVFLWVAITAYRRSKPV